jgi:GABA(A) receptor-associated protein
MSSILIWGASIGLLLSLGTGGIIVYKYYVRSRWTVPPSFKMEFQFQKDYPLEKRKAEGEQLRSKYSPRHVPVIIQRAPNVDLLANIDKNKYMLPSNLTVCEMGFYIRTKIRRHPVDDLFLIVNNRILPMDPQRTLETVFEHNHDDDLFLYIAYSDESILRCQSFLEFLYGLLC